MNDNPKVRKFVEDLKSKTGSLVLNHPVAVASIVVGVYAVGYYRGRSNAMTSVIRACVA